jgi:hypothetical protein
MQENIQSFFKNEAKFRDVYLQWSDFVVMNINHFVVGQGWTCLENRKKDTKLKHILICGECRKHACEESSFKPTCYIINFEPSIKSQHIQQLQNKESRQFFH